MIKYIVIFTIFSSILYSQSNFSSERIREAVNDHVINVNSSVAEIEFLQNIPDFNFNESGIHAEIDSELNDCGINRIFLSFHNSKRIIKYLELPVRLKYKMIVYTLNKTVGTGQVFDTMDFKQTSIITDKKCSDYIVNLNEINGKTASRNLSRGSIMKREMIAVGIVIRRGDRVSITATSGAVKIRTMGTALQDATVGQQVRIKRDNGSTLTGIAGADGVVYLDISSFSMR